MEKVSVACFLSSYALAAVFAVLRLRGLSRLNRVLTLSASTAGFAAHTAYLWVRGRNAELPPLLASTHDWVLVLAWVALLFYLSISLLDRELPLGVFVLPIVLALVVASQFLSVEPNRLISESELVAAASSRWILLHTSLLVFGIVGVIGSLILALMYLIQHRRLKHKQGMAAGVQLPSLSRLACWNRWAVIVAVPTLTLGMAAGVLLGMASERANASVEFADPIVIGSGIGWLVMVSFFGWLLGTKRPAAKQVALLTVWACSFLLLTIVGLSVLTGGGHQLVQS